MRKSGDLGTRNTDTSTAEGILPTAEEVFAEVEKLLEDRRLLSVKSPAAAGITEHYISDQDNDFMHGNDDIEMVELDMLISDAGMYRSKQYLGPEQERKTCIWRGGDVSWTVLSSGYSWIGVNGLYTTCVVAMSEPIRKRPDGKVQLCCETVLVAALADMLGDTEFSYHRRVPQSSIAGPFAVVSVAPSLRGQEGQDASSAINFLTEKLNNCSSLSSEETEQIAVSALKYLLGCQFKPDTIKIYGWGNYKGGEGMMSEERVLHAIRQTPTLDLTNSVSIISL